MKYQISESQYKKLVLRYLNSVASDFIFEDDDYEDNNWVDILIGDDKYFGSLWFKTIQNRGFITEGCNEELSLDHDFTQEFEQTIPIVMPKVFSQAVLEYFNSKTNRDCDCLEFEYHVGDGEDGSPLSEPYRYNINKN
jgi:hypothetical protein